MSHNCRSQLCEAPHYDLDGHADECGCVDCHELREHDWREWAIYPECHGCLRDMAQWIHENTDFQGCPIPALCEYSPECKMRFKPGLVA